MIKYRKADTKDKGGAAAVLLKNYNIKSAKEAEKVFLEELGRYNYLVAEDNGKIVGIACWRIHGLPKHQVAECGRVAILPEYMKKGIKTEMFEKLVQEADKFYKTHGKKVRKIYAYVHSSNKRMQSFYEHIGMIKEAALKDHYYRGEDEFIYSIFFD